jgi:hypothetical protein
MILKKNFTNKYYNLKNNILEESFSDEQKHNVIEDSSNSDNEILRIKNILKIGTPFARAFTVFTYSP